MQTLRRRVTRRRTSKATAIEFSVAVDDVAAVSLLDLVERSMRVSKRASESPSND
jgi:glutamate mutase epsilon subunit